MRRLFAALLFACSVASAAEPWSTPNEAAHIANLDLGTAVAIADQPYQFYIWEPDRDAVRLRGVNYMMNLAASRSRIIQQGVPVGGLLLRYDLRTLDPPDGYRLRSLLNGLVDEPDFHITHRDLVKVEPYEQGGKTWNYRWQATTEFAFHADPNELLSLSALMKGCDVPIIESRYLMSRMLTSVDNPGTPFRDGLYYEFRGIERKPKTGTARDAYLLAMGVSKTALEDANPKSKVAIFASGVAGERPRAVVAVFATNGRPADVPALVVTATLDIQDGDVDPAQHPLKTLIGAKFRASEVIGFAPNGLPSYALFNAKGELQDSVPETIARDGDIPFPLTSRLQASIGCIRCHGREEGWKPVGNDVADMLAAGFVPFFDATQGNQFEGLDRILGEYQGNLDSPLTTLRNGHNALALRATGGAWGVKSASTAAATIASMFAEREYQLIGAEEALIEIGRDPKLDGDLEGEERLVAAKAAFELAIPKLEPADLTPDMKLGRITAVDDPTIAGLRYGKKILRADFDHIKADLYLRSQATRKRVDAPVAAGDNNDTENKP